MSEDQEYQQRMHNRAAMELAIAARNLRDADDALVMYGRTVELHDWPDDDHPTELCDNVAKAYAEMRAAEKKYQETAVPS